MSDDLPTPQAPEMPIDMGLPFDSTMIRAAVSAIVPKLRKSTSVSLSDHVIFLLYAHQPAGGADHAGGLPTSI